MNWLRRHFRTFIRLRKWWHNNVTRNGRLLFFAMLCCVPTLAQVNLGDYLLFWTLASLLATTALVNRWKRPIPQVRLSYDTTVQVGSCHPLQVQLTDVDQRLAGSLIVSLCRDETGITALAHPAVLDTRRLGSSAIWRQEFSATRRGRYQFPAIRIASCYPFGLFQMGSTFTATKDIVVLPAYVGIECGTFREAIVRQHWGEDNETELVKRHRDGDYSGTRDFQDGMMDIQWDYRTWARTGVPAVREYSCSSRPNAAVLLDTYTGHATRADAELDVAFEASVALTAAVCNSLSESGFHIRCVGDGVNFDSTALPTHNALPEMLESLAEIQRTHDDHLTAIISEHLWRCELICIVYYEWNSRQAGLWQQSSSQSARTLRIFVDRHTALQAGASTADFVASYGVHGQLTGVQAWAG